MMTNATGDDHVVAMTRAQRLATVDVLDGLTDDEWERQTLCEGWTAAHLAAHMSMAFRIGISTLLMAMVRTRGDFDRAADRLARRDIERMSHVQLVEVLRDNLDTRWKPPGGDLGDSLCHDVIHGLDLTEGLARPSTATPQQLKFVLDTIDAKDRVEYFGGSLDGRRLIASDVDFSIGEGPVVEVPAVPLVLILTGRTTVAEHLRTRS